MKNCCTLLIVLLILLTSCSHKQEQTNLTVSAASSLSDSLQEIAALFQEEHPDIQVQFNFGASGALKKQIEQGAPVDMFISASTKELDELIQQDLIEDVRNLLRNELVLISSKHKGNVKSFQDITKDSVEKIAIGSPETVPAGKYGMQALQYYGGWESVQSKIVYAKDVRQVLTYVETENVQAGIVYKTDALTSDKVHIVETAMPDAHDKIIYPAGVVKNTKNSDAAHIFLNYLTNNKAQKIWEKYGFEME